MNYYFSNGELYHARSHKYIRRQWVNGRWRYWYPETGNTATDYSGHLNYKMKYPDRLTSRDPNYEHITRARVNVRNDIEDRVLGFLNDPSQKKFREQDLKTLEANRRERGVYTQELNRIEEARRNKKLKNRFKRQVKKAKNWLNSIVTTKITVDFHPKKKEKTSKWLTTKKTLRIL